MSENGLTSAQHKMRDAGVAEQAITVFTHYYQSLEAGATGLIPEETIEPLTQIDSLADVEVSEEQAREALSKTVLIRLNGGLAPRWGWIAPSRSCRFVMARPSWTCWSIRSWRHVVVTE